MIRSTIALGAGLMLWAGTAHGATTCPASIEQAKRLYTTAAPITAENAAALAVCSDHLSRELGLAALGDMEPTPQGVAMLIAGLDDPRHSVRAQALIWIVRNAEAVRPALVGASGNGGASAAFGNALTKGELALAALAVIGLGSAPPQGLLEPYASLLASGPATTAFGPVQYPQINRKTARIDADNFYERQIALALNCIGGTQEEEEDDAPFSCPSLPPADMALAEMAFAQQAFEKSIQIFDSALSRIAAERQARAAAAQPADSGDGSGGMTRDSSGDIAWQNGESDWGTAAAESDDAQSSRVGAVRAQQEAEYARAREMRAQREAEYARAREMRARQEAERARQRELNELEREHLAAEMAAARRPAPTAEVGAAPPGAVAAAERKMPRFPWPAPKPVKQQVIPVARVGGPNATLEQVRATLERQISAASSGYEIGLFAGPPGGFVMLTRMERIQSDGSPFPGSHRFTTKGNPKAGFWDMLTSLMGEKPGYFRVIAFVVADELSIDPAAPVSSVPSVSSGAAELPRAIARQKLGNKHVYALVYAFERPNGRAQRPWIEGAPSALTHLRLSGIAQGLGM